MLWCSFMISKTRFKQIGVVLIFVSIFALGVALLAMAGRQHTDSIPTKPVSALTIANCSLGQVSVISCAQGGFISTWTTLGGKIAVQNPFSTKVTLDLATRDSNDYPL